MLALLGETGLVSRGSRLHSLTFSQMHQVGFFGGMKEMGALQKEGCTFSN